MSVEELFQAIQALSPEDRQRLDALLLPVCGACGAAGGAPHACPGPPPRFYDIVIQSVPLNQRMQVMKALHSAPFRMTLQEAASILNAIPTEMMVSLDDHQAREAFQALERAGAVVELAELLV